jgi:hypothetical protein
MFSQYRSPGIAAMYHQYMVQYSRNYARAAPYQNLQFYGCTQRYGRLTSQAGDGVFDSQHAGMVSGVDFVNGHLQQDISRLLRVD